MTYLGGPLGDAPPFGLNTHFFEHIEPKKIFKISGEGAQPPPQTCSSVGRGHLLPTLHPIGASGASNLASLALPPPPSQNPKYATARMEMFSVAVVSGIRLSVTSYCRHGCTVQRQNVVASLPSSNAHNSVMSTTAHGSARHDRFVKKRKVKQIRFKRNKCLSAQNCSGRQLRNVGHYSRQNCHHRTRHNRTFVFVCY